jgi:hypothetical protein
MPLPRDLPCGGAFQQSALSALPVTVESLISEAEQARRGAMGAGQYAAAVAAVKEKGVLSGKRVERRESGSPGEFADLENMTAEQLAGSIRKQAKEYHAAMDRRRSR